MISIELTRTCFVEMSMVNILIVQGKWNVLNDKKY